MSRGKRTEASDLDSFMAALIKRMERHDTVESLNDNVITPFAMALERVCESRGYLLNIYGERSNVIVSSEESAEVIYQLVETYLDEKDVEVR